MRIFAPMEFKKTLLALVAAFSITSSLSANNDVVPTVHRDIHRVLQEQQDVARSFQSMVDSVETLEGEKPFELYPSLDLYAEGVQTGPRKPVVSGNNVDIDLTGWVAPIKGMITSPYGWRKKRMHKGIDIKLYVGDTVRAAFDGVIRIRKFEKRGYGNYYVITHENGLETIYGHLSKHIAKEGATVKAGQAIGLGGSTGRSTGPHLHFEMRYSGIALDPADLINLSSFEAHDTIYKLDRKRAEWAQNNKGKSGAKYNANATRVGKPAATATAAAKAGNGVHIVKKGESLSAIARKYGTTVSRLCKLNNMKVNATLPVGKRIRYK